MCSLVHPPAQGPRGQIIDTKYQTLNTKYQIPLKTLIFQVHPPVKYPPGRLPNPTHQIPNTKYKEPSEFFSSKGRMEDVGQ